MAGRATKLQQTSIIENHDAEVPQSGANSLTPKLRKGAKSKYIIEEHPIMDGTGKVVRTRHTGDTYHCFFYVKDEKKWLRKSLHTKKLPEALEAGRKLMMITLTKLELGERIFNKSIQDVVTEFLESKQAKADAKFITQGRVTTIRSTLNWAMKFVGGPNTSITSFDGNDWQNYYIWRRTQKPDVRDFTLVNERSMINEMYKFADQRRYINRRNVPIFDRSISKAKSVERRDAFTQAEYNHLCSILRYFDQGGKNETERSERRFIRDFFMISVNTGLRFGELRRIKWRQVEVLDQCDQHDKPYCVISLDSADTKNRKARKVQGMRGDFFTRIKEYSKHTKPSDYVL
jgi:integrase